MSGDIRIEINPGEAKEWEEWRSLPCTKQYRKALEQEISDLLHGYAQVPAARWADIQLECKGMQAALDLASDLGREM